MQVKITFIPWRDEKKETLTYILMDIMLRRIDEMLYRTPDYVVRGKHKLTLTFYGLSKKEADTIFQLANAEIIEDGLVRRVIRINSRMEEDTGPFLSVRPEYMEGAREELEDRKGFVLDIQKYVGGVLISILESTAKALYDDYEDLPAPLTTLAVREYDAMNVILGLDSDEPEDERKKDIVLTFKTANTPMYKESKRRPRKPRAPRQPRNGSPRDPI